MAATTPFFDRSDWRLLDRIYSHNPALLDQVLQPDRAAGLLNDDDYACLKREMFWVNRAFRRYRTPIGVFVGMNAAVYVHRRRMNPTFRHFPPHLRWMPAMLAGAAGYFFTEFDAMATDKLFMKQLRDPQAVLQSVHNVRSRIEQAAKLKQEQLQESQSHDTWHNDSHVEDTLSASIGDNATSPSSSRISAASEGSEHRSNTRTENASSVVSNPSSSGSQRQQQQSPQPASASRSRWDEIRASNARSTIKTSSWDVLREQHQREQVSNSGSAVLSSNDAYSSSLTVTPFSRDPERAAEQAKFDALLEAERRRSSS